MTQSLVAKRIPMVMWMTVGLAAFMLVGTLSFSAYRANEIAKETSLTMIRGGLDAERTRMTGLAYDYSVWDAAYEAVAARDTEWLFDNMGSGALYVGFGFMQLYWPTDGHAMVWAAETGEDVQPSALSPDFITEVHRQLNEIPVGEVGVVAHVTEIYGKPYLVAASRVEPEDVSRAPDPSALAINFMGQPLEPEYIAGIGNRFLIDDLRLQSGFDPGELSIPVVGVDGSSFGSLDWTPPKPGRTLALDSVQPLLLVFLLFLALSRWVARYTSATAAQLVAQEQESAILARTDYHTKLPNRLAFMEHYEKALDQNTAEIALLVTDLNGFKQINDTKGHATGDALIMGLAKRIEEMMTDDIFLARMGGDEFSFIFTGEKAEERLRGFASVLKNDLEAAFYLEGEPFHISMSMGYAVRRHGDSSTPMELIRQADTAMYASKASKSYILAKYDPALNPNRMRELELETALRKALETPEEFSVVYQQICGKEGEDIQFAEALVRWNSPEIGSVSPVDFIPIAEATGMISQITAIVLEKVCRDLARAPDMTVSVNISPVEINDANFHNLLAETTRKYNVRPDQIFIELTEGVLVENPRGLASALQRLTFMGHRIALDDFGSGYSSIGYLRQMDFALLKVDKSLVRGATKNKRSREILQATIKIAKAFNIDILAEGVETPKQAELMNQMGFNMQQGFNFGGAVALEDLIDNHCEAA